MCDFCNDVESNLNILHSQFSIPFVVMCWIPEVKLGKGMFQHVLFFLLTFFPFPGLQSAPLGWDQAWKVSAQMEAFEKVLNIWQWGYHGNLSLSFFSKYSHNSFHVTENYTQNKIWKALSQIQNVWCCVALHLINAKWAAVGIEDCLCQQKLVINTDLNPFQTVWQCELSITVW